MNVFDAIKERRSIKHYDPAHTMPAEDEGRLLDLAREGPTSFNLQNWRFVIVRDKSKRVEIRKAAWDQAQVTDASLLLVICADLKAHEKDPTRYWADAPAEARDVLVPMITPFYDGRDWLARDEGMRSVGMAAQTLILSAKAMGYETSPMIGFDQDAVAKIINLPKDHAIGMVLAIGKGTKGAWPKGGYLPREEVVIEDAFPA
ncbi:MAG: nitroreductase family protein [Pseudomonadota bacterium]